MHEPFSLDTPAVAPDFAMSGHNFREVAPEILSPLSWSIVGAGMERGMRQVAAHAGLRRLPTQPQYVAYRAFRPFHVTTTIETIAAGFPFIGADDIWPLLLGGPRPSALPPPPRFRSRTGRLCYLLPELRLLETNGVLAGQVASAVAAAEVAVMNSRAHGQDWRAGSALQAASDAGRLAWSLHTRTTCVAVAAVALLGRLLTIAQDERTSTALLLCLAHRGGDAAAASGHPGRLCDDDGRLLSYEVADESEAFAVSTTSTRLGSSAAAARREGDVSIPTGTPAGRQAARVRRWVEQALAERERSKELGLRALHCTRTLLDGGALRLEPGDAAMLSTAELLASSTTRARELVAARRADLDRARGMDLPVDCRVSGTRIQPLPRTIPASGSGTPLAPGWAEGRLSVDGLDVEEPVLFGTRVDANVVLARRPVAVVTELGSVISHLAIVCRELGVPLLSGLRVDPTWAGATVAVDGWTGALDVRRTS